MQRSQQAGHTDSIGVGGGAQNAGPENEGLREIIDHLTRYYNKKAVLSQGNRAMPQLFFLI